MLLSCVSRYEAEWPRAEILRRGLGTPSQVLRRVQGQGIRTFRTFRTITKVLFFFEYRNTTCRYKYRKLVTRGLHLSEKLWWTDSGLVTHELQMRYARTPPPIPFRTIVFLSTVYPLKLCYSLPLKGAPTQITFTTLPDSAVQWLCTHRTTTVPRYVSLYAPRYCS